MEFDLPKDRASIIKVIGVGGGGSNAVNYMYDQGINGVDFMICNTDHQALDKSLVPVKIQLGETLTQGLGAGSLPDIGRDSAIESIEELKAIFSSNTKMVFITAGMGGGTGTGAAPIIAAAAKEMGILTVGIVTIPFSFEGKKRRQQAEEGLKELRENVDTLLIINNDKLREIYGNLSLKSAFAQADNVLTTAAKGIAEVITVPGYINVDFNDINTVMSNGGNAIMGYGIAEGEGRALKAVEDALNSPLLNDNNIFGASKVLLYITSGVQEVTMDEVGEISDYIQEEAGSTANIIFGCGFDETLGDKIRAIVIATGFNSKKDFGMSLEIEKPQRKELNLNNSFQKIDNIVNVVENKEIEKTELFELKEMDTTSEVKAEVKSFEPNFENKLEEEKEVLKTEENQVDKIKSEETVTVKFDLDAPKKIEFLSDFNTNSISIDNVEKEKFNNDFSNDEQARKNKERIDRLRSLNFNKAKDSYSEMESIPAWKRKNIELDNIPHSSDNEISRFTLSEGLDNNTEVRPNNSFLHDNVD
jgi:cell division protein FtsZ